MAADILALGNRDVRSEQDGGDEACLQWLAIDLLLDELAQHAGALGVADEHEAAAVVPGRQVMLPGAAHVVVGELEVRRRNAADDGGDRALPVDGRKQAAL